MRNQENLFSPFARVGEVVDKTGKWEFIEFYCKKDFMFWVERKLNPSHQPEKIGDKPK